MRAHLRLGNHVTLIAGFRNSDLLFWVQDGERVARLQAEFPDLLYVIYTSNDGSFWSQGASKAPSSTAISSTGTNSCRALTSSKPRSTRVGCRTALLKVVQRRPTLGTRPGSCSGAARPIGFYDNFTLA